MLSQPSQNSLIYPLSWSCSLRCASAPVPLGPQINSATCATPHTTLQLSPMSFAQPDLEAQKSPPPSPSKSTGSPELDVIIANTSSQIQRYGQFVSEFANSCKLLGSRRDVQSLRDNISNAETSISSLGDAIRNQINQVNALLNTDTDTVAVSGRQLMTRDRLVADFNNLSTRFQQSLRNYHQRSELFAVKKAAAPPAASESSPLLQSDAGLQSQVQVNQELVDQAELEFHVLMTEERNREIAQVHESIRDLNMLFKDLAEMVQTQGTQLDRVQDNILRVSAENQETSRELRKASEKQRRGGKCRNIALVVAGVVVLLIILVAVS